MQFEFDAVMARLLDKVYGLAASLPLLLLALALVCIGWLLGRWISRGRLIQRISRRNPLLRGVLETSTQWFITGLALALALDMLNATAIVGAVLGTAGIVGIIIGFAFKDTLENYLAGVLMSLRQPFAPRDLVEIDGAPGTVIALTSRATILMTPDGNHLRLPNAKVFRAAIVNYTRNPQRRFEFDVGIGVREDLLLARQLGIERLCQVDGVIASPAPTAFIVSLGDSSVQMACLAFGSPSGWLSYNSDGLTRGEPCGQCARAGGIHPSVVADRHKLLRPTFQDQRRVRRSRTMPAMHNAASANQVAA
jgi:small conductance mechanosensitive channel